MKYLILALAFAGVAHARETPCNANTPNNAICLIGTAPTTREDGAPTVLAISLRVEQRVGTGAWTTVGTYPRFPIYLTGLAPGMHYFLVYATESGFPESRASNEASREATAVPTNPPVIQVVQVVIGMDHAPVYKLTQENRRDERYKDACGYVPVGAACSGDVLYEYRKAKFRRVSESDVKPWDSACTGNVVAPCS